MQIFDRNRIARALETFCDNYPTYSAAAKALNITLAQLSTARHDPTTVIPARALDKLGYGYTFVYVRKEDVPNGKKPKPKVAPKAKKAAPKPKPPVKKRPPAKKPATAKPPQAVRASKPAASKAKPKKTAPRASKPKPTRDLPEGADPVALTAALNSMVLPLALAAKPKPAKKETLATATVARIEAEDKAVYAEAPVKRDPPTKIVDIMGGNF